MKCELRVCRLDTPEENASLEEFRRGAWQAVAKSICAFCHTSECWDLWPQIGSFVSRIGAVFQELAQDTSDMDLANTLKVRCLKLEQWIESEASPQQHEALRCVLGSLQSDISNALFEPMRTRCMPETCTRQHEKPPTNHSVQCDGCAYFYCGNCCPLDADQLLCPACQRGAGPEPASTVGGFV